MNWYSTGSTVLVLPLLIFFTFFRAPYPQLGVGVSAGYPFNEAPTPINDFKKFVHPTPVRGRGIWGVPL